MIDNNKIVNAVLKHFPDVQAIYLFGTYGTDDERPDSDVDIALLLPHKSAKEIGSLVLTALHDELDCLINNEVDLINLRTVSTVLQKEIITAERKIYCANQHAADEFEMLVFSAYQKLNEERKEILQDFFKTGKAYDV